MSGDIILDEKQKWALYFAGILKNRGFDEAAKSLTDTFSPFAKSKDEDAHPKEWRWPKHEILTED